MQLSESVTFYLGKDGERVLSGQRWKRVETGHFLRRALEALLMSEPPQEDFFPGESGQEKAEAGWGLFLLWFEKLLPRQLKGRFTKKVPAWLMSTNQLEPVLRAWNRCLVWPDVITRGWLVLAPSAYHAACAESLLLVMGRKRPGFRVCPRCFKVHREAGWTCRACRKEKSRPGPPPRTPERRLHDRLRQAKSRGLLTAEEYGTLLGLLKNDKLEEAERLYVEMRRAKRAEKG
jgi:hypothetical protein